MSRLFAAVLTFCLLQPLQLSVSGQSAAARKSVQQDQGSDVETLRNEDILSLLKAQLSPEIVIAKIRSSQCEFDLSPQKLIDLRSDGVPDAVVVVMLECALTSASVSGKQSLVTTRIPDGTSIAIETPFTISSLNLKPNDQITFRVANPVKLNDVTVIKQGATVTGRVERSKRGGHFGKAGLLVWTINSVTAVDGSQVPLRAVPLRQRGDSKAAKVATSMVVTGALLWIVAPVALLHGFKRGGDAYIPEGKRFEVFVNGEASIKVKPTN